MSEVSSSSPSSADFTYLSDEKVANLTHRQKEMYAHKRREFIQYLKTRGKNRERERGYAASEIRPRARQIQQVFDWLWEGKSVKLTLTQSEADEFVEKLATDEICRDDGKSYAESTKRKFTNVLENWFEWEEKETNAWEPPITFDDEDTRSSADPFTRNELDRLCEVALTYQSVPTYHNLSPDERDRWKGYIAQVIGKPKDDVTIDDWDHLKTQWKIPSLVHTARKHGWRPAMVGRLKVSWYNEQTQSIHIPAGEAVKNDSPWAVHLSQQSATLLEKWLDQRENIAKYDDSDHIWLNREGNPYNSKNLNSLVNTLMEEAGISQHGRKLNWSSFRHSVGTYVFEETRTLRMVAEMLRQKSTGAAEHYVHPTPESKRELAEKL